MKPTYKQAIEAGVSDNSYNTTANGWVKSYSGKATVTMPDGSIWECVGTKCTGDAYYAYDGEIIMTKI